MNDKEITVQIKQNLGIPPEELEKQFEQSILEKKMKLFLKRVQMNMLREDKKMLKWWVKNEIFLRKQKQLRNENKN